MIWSANPTLNRNRPMLRGLVLDFDCVILESNQLKTDVFREIVSWFPEHVEELMAFHRDNTWQRGS